MQIRLFKRLPFILKIKCILLLYWLTLVMEICLMSMNEWPKAIINETSTMSAGKAFFKVVIGQTVVVNKETVKQIQDIQEFSLMSLWAILTLLTISAPFVFYCRCAFIRRKITAISEFCRFDKAKYREIKKIKYDFNVDKRAELRRNEKIEIERVLLLENSSVILGLLHGNLLTDAQIPECVQYTNLQRFMFSDLDWIYGLGYVVLTRYMKDLLRAVRYLHKQNIYHLDIQPTNILIMRLAKNEKGSFAKLGGFQYAKKIEGGKIASSDGGLKDKYRPPECFKSDEVDAAKFDCWGIGITAFDAFTGGMLTILSNSEEHACTKFFELFESRQLLEQSFFVSALDNSWDVFETMYRMQITLSAFTSMYDLDAFEFAPDCWNFVKDLLKFDPVERCSVEKALEAPLIKKLYEGEKQGKVKKPRILHI